jgi:hypothetical protein
MATREIRQCRAESYIKTLAAIVPLKPTQLPHMGVNWASDGSMVPAASGIGDVKSVTAALTGPKSIVLRLDGHNISILQGELIMGLLMTSGSTGSTTLYSDHLNSVRLIEDLRSKIGQETRLRSINGRSYYRWIANLISRTCASVIHTKSHTDKRSLALLLNSEAVHYASQAQNAVHVLPIAPIPTFYMEDFALYCDSDGWIESNICIFVDYFMARQTAKLLSSGQHHRMTTWIYDPRLHQQYPYTKAASAYSEMVWLYARSGQLPTASGMKQKGQVEQSGCRYGCQGMEDVYHIFMRCERFRVLRLEAVDSICKKSREADWGV